MDVFRPVQVEALAKAQGLTYSAATSPRFPSNAPETVSVSLTRVEWALVSLALRTVVDEAKYHAPELRLNLAAAPQNGG